MRKSLSCCILFLFLLALSDRAHSAQPEDRIALSLGVLTSLHHSPLGVGILEYRSHFNLLSGDIYLNPMGGILGNTDGGVYGYAGLRLGFPLPAPWHWENAVGVGAYSHGNGPDLYDPLEFCLAVSITRKISDKMRIGIQLFHISNAGLRDHDPGANSFVALTELKI